MFRELSRSTLYSSSWPFSSSATRRSSFSTLRMSLLPVLREERPKIFFTLSIIKLRRLSDQKWKSRGARLRCTTAWRSEEHTSELQSQSNLVCRLLLEKKNHIWNNHPAGLRGPACLPGQFWLAQLPCSSPFVQFPKTRSRYRTSPRSCARAIPRSPTYT